MEEALRQQEDADSDVHAEPGTALPQSLPILQHHPDPEHDREQAEQFPIYQKQYAHSDKILHIRPPRAVGKGENIVQILTTWE